MSSTRSVKTFLTSATALLAVQAFSTPLSQPEILPWISPMAIAQSSIKYTPPNRPTPARTDGTGVRSSPNLSCRQTPGQMFLATMAPTTHPGETRTGRPTVYAYFTGSQPLEFRLTEVGKTKPLITQMIQADRPGFIPIAYPETQPELAIGKEYRWSVEVVCNPKRRYDNVGRTEASIRRVDPPKSLNPALMQAKTVSNRASIYAAAGLWYDAVDQLVSGTFDQPDNAALQTELLTLLEQGGLNKTVEHVRKTKQASHCIPSSFTTVPRDRSSPSPATSSVSQPIVPKLVKEAGYSTSGAAISQQVRCP